MKKKPTNISASVLTRLKNIADKEQFDFNFLTLRYIQERFLARLEASAYANKFVLKGGFLLLAYNIHQARPTRDIDFLGINLSQDQELLESIIAEIASIEQPDGVSFIVDSIRSEIIKEDADYPGIRVKMVAKIGTARNRIQIDFAFDDVVTPRPLQMDYPNLLDEGNLHLWAYSKETIVAEKLEAIVKLTTFNTRMKDFYDIAFLSKEFDFDGKLLQSAIRNTFERRQTNLNAATDLLNSDLGDQDSFKKLWEAFERRTRIPSTDSFNITFSEIRDFVLPVVESDKKIESLVWKRVAKKWR